MNNNELIKRAIKENIEASTSFTDKSIAIKAVKENLRKNINKIEDWLNSDKGRAIFEVTHEYSIGKGIHEDRKHIIYELSNSRVILVKDTNSDLGFKILTAFPIIK